MIRIRDISFPPRHDANQLMYEAARALKLSPSQLRRLTIVRRSVAKYRDQLRILPASLRKTR